MNETTFMNVRKYKLSANMLLYLFVVSLNVQGLCVGLVNSVDTHPVNFVVGRK